MPGDCKFTVIVYSTVPRGLKVEVGTWNQEISDGSTKSYIMTGLISNNKLKRGLYLVEYCSMINVVLCFVDI